MFPKTLSAGVAVTAPGGRGPDMSWQVGTLTFKTPRRGSPSSNPGLHAPGKQRPPLGYSLGGT
ncbi:hypothetical protein TorRG33x02_099970, partial [Trema orientale]